MSKFGTRIVSYTGGIAALVVCVGLFATQVENKPYGVHDLERDKWEKKQTEIRDRQQAISEAAVGKRELPAAHIENTRFDFGTPQPFSSVSHSFRISNRGAVGLQLKLQKSSSASLVAAVPESAIAPGEDAEILVRWDVAEASGPVEQSVSIGTNDPFHHTIRLTLSGRIPEILAMSETRFSAPRVEPDQLVEASTVIYSQIWDDFQLASIQCDLESFQWSAEPLSDSECKEHGCRSAYRVRLSVSRTTKGTFEAPVKILVQPPASGWRPDTDARAADHAWLTALHRDEPLELDSSFHGRVISRIGFYGRDLHVGDGLDMGLTTCGTRQEFPLLVRYHGQNLPERLAVLDIQPPQLEASMEAIASRPGTYRLVVCVPADASQVVFNADEKHGFVKVGDPQHPEINNWFPVMGAIVEDPQSYRQRN